ncbi:MAG: hypothetical protein J6A37_11445 [Oscillospiraceae bacterium]|nr:hypothetical protein [Oscillospiraceae bacterium]
MEVIYEDNFFMGVTVDTYNNKEYIIYSDNGMETYYTGKIGSFLFEHFKYTDQILTPSFFEAQKHLKLNSIHQYDVSDVLRVSAPDIISEWESSYNIENGVGVLFLIYRNCQQYLIAEKNKTAQISLIIEYINKLYAAGLFPRQCMNCDSLFLSHRKHGDVLCSNDCKRKSRSANTKSYYASRSENEQLYLKIYRKWKQRIYRAEVKLSKDAAKRLNRELSRLTTMHKSASTLRKAGRFDENEWSNMLLNYDKELYELWDNIKAAD